MHPFTGNLVAFVLSVEYIARAAHAFNAEITCRHCRYAVEDAHIRIWYAHLYPCCLRGKAFLTFFGITRNTHRLHNGTGMKINVTDTHSFIPGCSFMEGGGGQIFRFYV